MTELIWDGKYDTDGKRTRPVRVALPFQDVETVNESAQVRTRMLDLFARNQPSEWRNRLIWGDKKYVLPSLLPEFAGGVDLIYIDPPFATGADFSFTASIPDDPEVEGHQLDTFVKQPSMIETKAYRDTWGRGLDSYYQWFYETLVLLHELIKDNGSIFIHVGKPVAHGVKLIADEIFGVDGFANDITWKRSHAHGDTGQGARHFGRVTETILLYAKGTHPVWNPQYEEYSDVAMQRDYKYVDEATGERYRLMPVDGPGGAAKGNPFYEFQGVRGYFRYSKETMEQLHADGEIVVSSTGKSLSRKRYLRDAKGTPVTDLWDTLNRVSPTSGERLGYPTQKPEVLIERVIRTATNENDLVLDCFAGSGTTAAVAEKLNRRWITADLGRFSIHTTRKRLLSLPEVKPFVIQNLGKYERQAWQTAEFAEQDATQAALAQARYRSFILDLYNAQPLEGYAWLHGVKGGHFVHVGSVDAPVVNGDIQAIAREFWKAVGQGTDASVNTVDILGWDFAFELNELGREMAREANIHLNYKKIPRDVMDRRAVDAGEIRFFELGALAVEVTNPDKLIGQAALTDFVVPPDDVPADVQAAITHWSQYIDYWAIDWDYKGDTFHNLWQSYRTKKQTRLELSARHAYDAPGTYTVVVKVIDILGNDTTKSVKVEVK